MGKKMKEVICQYCKGKFFTRMLKVYVFKERKCPKCGGIMFAYNGLKIMKCRKCTITVEFSDTKQLAQMAVSIKGTSKSFKVASLKSAKGIEIDRHFIPQKRYCQRCRNLRTHMLNNLKKRNMNPDARELSLADAQRLIKASVMQKLKTDFDAKLKKEREDKKKAKLNKKHGIKPKKKGPLSETEKILQDKKLMAKIREARKKGSKSSPYKPLETRPYEEIARECGLRQEEEEG